MGYPIVTPLEGADMTIFPDVHLLNGASPYTQPVFNQNMCHYVLMILHRGLMSQMELHSAAVLISADINTALVCKQCNNATMGLYTHIYSWYALYMNIPVLA